MLPTNTFFGPLAIIVAALLWSADGLLRVSLYALPAPVVVLYEHLLGAIVMLFLGKYWLQELRKLTKRQWTAITAVALFSGALGTLCYTAALGYIQYSSYSVVVLLQQQLQPLWVMLTAALFLKEKITRSFLAWAGVALVGAYFTSFPTLQVNFQTGAGTLLAAGLALAAGVLWGSSTALSKYALKDVSFLTGVGARFFLTPLFAFGLVVATKQTEALFHLTLEQWLTLLIITFSTGLVALGFYYAGLKRTPARIATLCELVWPASAVLIDWIRFHKTLTITQLIGIGLILVAISQVTRMRDRHQPTSDPAITA